MGKQNKRRGIDQTDRARGEAPPSPRHRRAAQRAKRARSAQPPQAVIGPPALGAVEAQPQVGNAPTPPPPDDIIFDLNQKRTRFSDQFLLDQVRAFGQTVGGRAFGTHEFMAWPARQCTATSISRRFGSWRRALATVGIRGALTGRYTAQELMDRLETTWRAVGRRPSWRALRKHAFVTLTPYRDRWGTYMNACTRLARYKQGRITLKELLRPCAHGPRKSISPGTRWNILNRDGHRCRSCGRSAGQRGVRLEVDHIVPVSAGGSNAMSNLRTLCRDCNRGKSGKLTVKRRKRSTRRSGERLRTAR